MTLPADVINQVFSLSAHERFELAQQLLDSVDEATSIQLDREFLEELERRRHDMLRGEEIISDWRAELDAIEASLPRRQSG